MYNDCSICHGVGVAICLTCYKKEMAELKDENTATFEALRDKVAEQALMQSGYDATIAGYEQREAKLKAKLQWLEKEGWPPASDSEYKALRDKVADLESKLKAAHKVIQRWRAKASNEMGDWYNHSESIDDICDEIEESIDKAKEATT